jgi:wyosine [tRNA(Phe)-imidazoG37] synthetase (radical SAM superfamily)
MSSVFGPVPSRRLGLSLGIDLVPFKTCSYDCVYCQLGRTTDHTLARRSLQTPAAILRELESRLTCKPDYITLGGSGEPTLYADLGNLIAGIKRLTAIPIAVITNGSLLWQPEVRGELAVADLVSPSLDAGDAETFRRINRPCAGLDFDVMAQGLVDFRREYRGSYWLEILLVKNLNSGPESLAALRRWVERIAPDRVHLNTVARPPAEAGLLPLPQEELTEIARSFHPPAEVIAEYRPRETKPLGTADPEEILAMLQRHPGTADDVATGLSLAPTEAAQVLETMLQDGRLSVQECDGRRFFTARNGVSHV